MRTILMLILMVCSLTVSAESNTSLVLGGISKHLMGPTYTYKGERHSFNEKNLTVGFESEGVRIVVYDNSYHKTGIGAMVVPKWELNEYLSVGPRLGVTTGYNNTPVNMMLAPIVGAEVDVHYKGFHLVPAIQAPGVLTLHAQLDY